MNLDPIEKTTWIDKGSKFENKSCKSQLQKKNIEMHSTRNEG